MKNMLKKAYGNAAVVRPPSGPNLGTMLAQALTLHQDGRYAEAANIYGEILAVDPMHFDALHLLGVAALQTGNPTGALDLMDKAISQRPDASDALSNRSSALMDLNRFEDALDSCQKAIKFDPKNAEAYFNAGNALAKLGRRLEAIGQYEAALRHRPGFVACLTNLGGELMDAGRVREARAALDKALSTNPHHAKAWLNLGALLQEQGDRAAAHEAYLSAVRVQPNYSRARVNLSNMAFESGYWTEALTQGRTALELDPNLPEAHNAIGNCHRALGQPHEASASFRRAVELDPGSFGFHSNLLLSHLSDPETPSDAVLDEALRYGARHGGWAAAMPRPERPVKRIGFVSADFREHPVGFFLEPLLANLDGYEVFLYANQTAHDRQSSKLASLAEAWRPVRNLSTEDTVCLIQQDGIDILIDLGGHTSDSRLDVFAKRAAPVQVAWLGYSGTTGLSQFDALIGDSIVTPRQHEDFFSEPILRLPASFLSVYDTADLPEVAPLPAVANGHVTFGSFNATTKVHEGVVELWSRVLTAVPGSRLVFKNLFLGDPSVAEHYIGQFAKLGVERERVTLVGQTSRQEHLEAFSQVDIALDTFPYSGATTTIDNLVMGVPVVTLLGDRYAGRMSASFLTCAGLEHLVTNTWDEYVATAVGLCNDLDALALLRREMRVQVLDSPLGDAAGFARSFAKAMESLWEDAGARAA